MKGKKSARPKSSRAPSSGKQAVTALKKRILGRALTQKRLVHAGIVLGGTALLAALVCLVLALAAPIPVECHDLYPAELRAFNAAAERYRADTGTRLKIIEARRDGKQGPFTLKGLSVFRLSQETRAEATRFGEVPARLSGIVADSLTSSFRLPGTNGSLWAQPLLTDHLELFWTDADNLRGPETLADLTARLKTDARKGRFPLVMAGADDALLLDGIGQLVAALGGKESYDRLCELVKTGAMPETAASTLSLHDALPIYRHFLLLHTPPLSFPAGKTTDSCTRTIYPSRSTTRAPSSNGDSRAISCKRFQCTGRCPRMSSRPAQADDSSRRSRRWTEDRPASLRLRL